MKRRACIRSVLSIDACANPAFATTGASAARHHVGRSARSIASASVVAMAPKTGGKPPECHDVGLKFGGIIGDQGLRPVRS